MELAIGSLSDLFDTGKNDEGAETLKREHCKLLLKLPDLLVLLQLASGLNFLHARNIVHGDIKPENLLIFNNGGNSSNQPVQIKWSDFGFSKDVTFRGNVAELNDFSTSITSSKKEGLCTLTTIRGSLAWISPELIEVSKLLDAAKAQGEPTRIPLAPSDIFSFGLVAFYYVTRGIHPFGSYPCACRGKILVTIIPNIKKNNAINLDRLGKGYKTSDIKLIKSY